MLIQVSSGQGSPKECERACYLYYKELLNEFPSLEVVEINVSSKECLKSVVFYTDEDLEFLAGTVQWICQSPFRPNHKRKNWYIDVAILKEEYKLENYNDIKFESFRSSGAGGQNVNKVSSAVRAIHIPTGITAVSMDQRSQSQNKKISYLRLIKKIDEINSSINKGIQRENWNNHNMLVRGNPVRVYKGSKFKKIKK